MKAKWFESRIVWGVLLIVLGVLFLLQTFDVLGGILTLFWVFVFGAAGVAFLTVFLANRDHWWAVIPGFTLLSLAALIALNWLFPRAGETLGGTLFLGGIGLGFWVIYLIKREHWWAVIPGGVMFTVALVAGLASVLEGDATGGVLFLGIGLTFALLSVVPTPQGRIKWAIIPAAVLLLMGLLMTAAATPLIKLWPAALILAGLYSLFRAFSSR